MRAKGLLYAAVLGLISSLLWTGPTAAAAADCGGQLTFGEVAVCSSITGDREDSFTFTTTVDNDEVLGTLTRSSGDSVSAGVYDANGDYVCYFSEASQCTIPAAGTYTVKVALSYGEGTGDYTLGVQSTRTPANCETLPERFFSFASTGRAAELPKGAPGQCYRFDQPVGSVLRLWAPGGTGDVRGQIVDAEFQPVCPVQDHHFCTLGTPGPYQVVMREMYGEPASYTLRMSRVSQPAGCPVLPVSAFGDPGNRVATGSLGGQYTAACHRLRTPAAGGIAVRIHNAQSVSWTVFDNAGQQVCESFEERDCRLPAAGDYALITQNRDWEPITYQVAAAALFRGAGCASAKLTWAQDAAVAKQTSPVQTNCHQFRGTAGQRVISYLAPTAHNDLATWLVDSAGRRVCADYSEEDGCALPADGVYRVVSYLRQWTPSQPELTYRVQVRSLSAAAGCPVVRPGAYNGAPAGAAGPIRCRTLRITQPGTYRVEAYGDENYPRYVSVYDRTGHRICDNGSRCVIDAAGNYTMVVEGRDTTRVVDNTYVYTTTLLPHQPSGCPAATDQPIIGAFTATGQYLCRQLPQPAGAKVVQLLPTDATGSGYLSSYVVDAAGEYLCDSSWGLRQGGSCELTGTAPHSVVMKAGEGEAPGVYRTQFVRVDGAGACPAPTGTSITTSADRFAVCHTIPAGDRAARESFTWKRTSGEGAASISIFSQDGTRWCGPTLRYAERTVTCSPPAGAVTVVLETGAVDATYDFTHQAAQ